MPKRAGYIYALLEGDQIRYIGQTTNLLKRYYQHNSLAQNRGETHKQKWIRKMLSQGDIIMVSLEKTDDMDGREIALIKQYRENGIKLVNTSDGGTSFDYPNRVKLNKPWTNHHSPVQHSLMFLGAHLKESERLGIFKDWLYAEYVYQRLLNAVKAYGRDRVNMALYNDNKELYDKQYTQSN